MDASAVPPTLADASASLGDTAAAFRDWLADHADQLQAFRHPVFEDIAEGVARYRPLQAMLWDAGWNRLGWDPDVGGLGGSPVHRFVVADELVAAGYINPDILGSVEIIAPMLVRYSPALAARHVSLGVRGDEVWCQGFSEPDAGSDLGSLRTKATPDGDGYRISGQKMWSSNGHIASWCCVLARTGAADSGYRGLTMFWVDLSDPGVTVVPTECESGRFETAEIFFDDVAVPADRIIGSVGDGWSVVMYLMQFERGAYAWGRQAELRSQLGDLIDDPDARSADEAERIVGEAYLSVFAVRAQGGATIARLAAGEQLGPEISIDKILLSTAEQTMTEAARKLLWPRLELSDDPRSVLWRSRWSFSRITTIYGGAAEVQRDLVAERLLGLPRGR